MIDDPEPTTRDDPDLSFRVALDRPNPIVLASLQKRLEDAGVVVLRTGTLGIEARGPRTSIEKALGTHIEPANGGFAFNPATIDTGSEPLDTAFAYFPAKPTFYP